MSSLLSAESLRVRFGATLALADACVELQAGEVLGVVGRLGAGKSTLLRALAGMVALDRGEVHLDGVRIDHLGPDAVARRGVTLMPAGGGLFPALSVNENLMLATPRHAAAPLDQLLERFPILGERRQQQAGTLSGGEQRQLAVVRAVLREPRVLLLDEPLLGLAPQIAAAVADLLGDVAARGTAIVLVEERPSQTLQKVTTRLVGIDGGRLDDAAPLESAAPRPRRQSSRPTTAAIEVESVRIPMSVAEKRALQTLASGSGKQVGELLAELVRDHVATHADEVWP